MEPTAISRRHSCSEPASRKPTRPGRAFLHFAKTNRDRLPPNSRLRADGAGRSAHTARQPVPSLRCEGVTGRRPTPRQTPAGLSSSSKTPQLDCENNEQNGTLANFCRQTSDAVIGKKSACDKGLRIFAATLS